MKPPRLITIVCVFLGAGLVAGCKVPPSDIGKPCVLVKRDPNDTGTSGSYRSVDVTNSEVTAGKDFISFGSTECDDLVCVRDKDMPITGAPGDSATGYCSHPCAVGANHDCDADKANLQTDPRPLSCRAMLLDPDTIAALCNVDPAKCEELFGTNRSPYYCARSGTPPADGGTP